MASKKKKIKVIAKKKKDKENKVIACIAIILCFFIATIVFCILSERAGIGITDFVKVGIGWSIVWAAIIHFTLQELVFKKGKVIEQGQLKTFKILKG